MAYKRLIWVGSETPLSAQNFNNIEDGIEELKAEKVDKVEGKGLSTNDYTTEEKTKLAGITPGARPYTAGTGISISNGVISVSYGNAATTSF